MRIRSIHPQFWRSDDIAANDPQSWKSFGESGPGREFVYLLYDENRALLYVGITWNPFVRWTSHSRSKPWWPLVTWAEVWVCQDDEARAVEAHCIKTRHPRFNIHQAVVH